MAAPRLPHGRRRMMRAFLDVLLPPTCLACREPIRAGDRARLVCRLCRSRLRALPWPQCERCGAPLLRTGRAGPSQCLECVAWPAAVRAARSAVLLAPPADVLVHQLKYRGWHALAQPLAERMAALPLPLDAVDEARVCVPVPTTAARLRTRGYNQAQRIAVAYARLTRRRVAAVLERTRAQDTQTHLQPAARAANVAGAFRVRRGAEAMLHGAHVLLIDDVLTTGATAAECAVTLVAAGARCVTVVTFARALDARRLTAT